MNLKKNVKEINGPINVIRMEGKINDITKVIYIFMDQHVCITKQTQCNNIFSKDIQTYLAENFDNLNNSSKIYDFFFEVMPIYLKDNANDINYRDIYISEVYKLFRNLFMYRPKVNKVSVSKYFKNVRLHYMDIRNYFEKNFFNKLSEIDNIALSMLSHLDFNLNDTNYIISVINEFKSHVQLIYDIMQSYKIGKNKPIKKISIINFKQKRTVFDEYNYIFNKLFNLYKHKNVREKQLKLFDKLQDYMADLIKRSDEMVEQFEKIANNVQKTNGKLIKDETTQMKYVYGFSEVKLRSMLTIFVNTIQRYIDDFIGYYTLFMDMFFLRRFLDKDYITNAITYTGSFHSCVYIYTLYNDYGFRVTHVSYPEKINIKKINQLIADTKDVHSIAKIFYPQTISQCSDVSHFPDNFL
jgi:hypothetical protein